MSSFAVFNQEIFVETPARLSAAGLNPQGKHLQSTTSKEILSNLISTIFACQNRSRHLYSVN